MTKYYIDEPDVTTLGHPIALPLIGVTERTVFYDTFEEADKAARELEERSEISFWVWEHEIP